MQKPLSINRLFAILSATMAGAMLLLIAPRTQAAITVSLQIAPNAGTSRTTAQEVAGSPPARDKTVAITAQYSSEPGNNTTVTTSVSGQCLLADYDKGGLGPASASYTDTFNQYNKSSTLYVWGVDDTKYEGKHSCTATVTTVSSNPEANGLTATLSIPIEDNDPAPAAPKPTTTTPRTTTPAAAPQPAAPPAIAVDTVKINDQTSTPTGEKPAFGHKEPVDLSGKTIPNGKVKLYIFSEPRTADVVADAQGNWTYTINDLEPGDHRVEAEVTDPATNKISPRAELAKFTVKEAKAAAPATTAAAPAKPASRTPLFVGAGLGLIALGAGGFFGYRWWKGRKSTPAASDTVSPTETLEPPELPEAADPTKELNDTEEPSEQDKDDTPSKPE